MAHRAWNTCIYVMYREILEFSLQYATKTHTYLRTLTRACVRTQSLTKTVQIGVGMTHSQNFSPGVTSRRIP